MPSIGAIGSVVAPAYQPIWAATRAPESAPSPSPTPVDRVTTLTYQLDASLTDTLAKIRGQISANGSVPTQSSSTMRRLDVSA